MLISVLQQRSRASRLLRSPISGLCLYVDLSASCSTEKRTLVLCFVEGIHIASFEGWLYPWLYRSQSERKLFIQEGLYS